MSRLVISPSVLAADFAHLGDQVRAVEAAGADLLHVDVMDGHFVPNLTMGIPVVEALKRASGLPLDVHLMIEAPDAFLEPFVRAGASLLSVHAEVCADLPATVARIHALGSRAGVALNPGTPVSVLAPVIDALDHVLVMSVHPGFTGQTFLPGTPAKVAAVRDLIRAGGSRAAIEVDGGVGLTNIRALCEAGATMVVAGAAIFHAADPAAALRALRAAAGI